MKWNNWIVSGQIGDQVPGAFAQMAKGLGMTHGEFSEALDEGGVEALRCLAAWANESRGSAEDFFRGYQKIRKFL